MSDSPTLHNVLIIGSGPAGFTAALYASRAGLDPIVFAGLQPGGQLMITTDVENYPGFPQGLLGPELMDLFQKQAEQFGTQVEYKVVTRVDLSERPFKVWCDDELYLGKSIIISTGAEAKWIGLEGGKTFGGFGVSACATCDGAFFKQMTVAVVGGGDTAMEEANYLTRHCSKVYVIHRRDSLRASKIMQERALANPKIEFIWNAQVVDIHGDTEPLRKVTGITLEDTVTRERRQMEVQGLFVAIGHKPNSELFQGALDMDDLGYLITEPHSTRTKVPGVFACGDVMDRVYRQAVTAAGTGCMAAIDAERWLESEGH
ncbi:MAG TPA: thioredoxin-disulfide reductase [Fimbriimonadaceae bacterium]|nr:thioredoxin-disulfide reductase [Fimbriimonadaceae bacterium]